MNDLLFHFLPEDRRLSYDDGREVRVGETLTVKGDPIMCERGLHASATPYDAMTFHRGPVLCVVQLGGVVKHGDNKSVGTERRCLWMRDVSATLRLFACDCAERSLMREREAGREPDARSWAAVEVARRYAVGDATEEERFFASASASASAAAASAAAAYASAYAYAAAASASERAWQRDRLMTLLVERDGLDLDSITTDSEGK